MSKRKATSWFVMQQISICLHAQAVSTGTSIQILIQQLFLQFHKINTAANLAVQVFEWLIITFTVFAFKIRIGTEQTNWTELHSLHIFLVLCCTMYHKLCSLYCAYVHIKSAELWAAPFHQLNRWARPDRKCGGPNRTGPGYKQARERYPYQCMHYVNTYHCEFNSYMHLSRTYDTWRRMVNQFSNINTWLDRPRLSYQSENHCPRANIKPASCHTCYKWAMTNFREVNFFTHNLLKTKYKQVLLLYK